MRAIQSEDFFPTLDIVDDCSASLSNEIWGKLLQFATKTDLCPCLTTERGVHVSFFKKVRYILRCTEVEINIHNCKS